MDHEIKEDQIIYFSNKDGNDDNPGILKKPVATFQKAIELCNGKKKRSILDKDRIDKKERL